jgi:hypothetical protein
MSQRFPKLQNRFGFFGWIQIEMEAAAFDRLGDVFCLISFFTILFYYTELEYPENHV